MPDRLDDNGKKRKKREDNSSIYRNLSLITQFTLYMLVPIGGLSAGGYFLDKYFHTSWIIIVCFFVGAIAGAQAVYRLAMKIANEKSKEPERNILNRPGRKSYPSEETDTSIREEKTPEKADDKLS
ncbi:MAG: AtpZ/AtpI family protein [Lachnospiraceae bacterium]|nr:AtpZ/AtpI family protein [Lachnospiraceae bacterium]